MNPTDQNFMHRAWCEYQGMEYIEGNVNPLPSENFEKGYEYGRRDVLASQWRSVDDEMPDEDEFVLCRMKSNGAIVGGYITKKFSDYPMVATDSNFHFEDWGANPYECTHWMPLPDNTPGFEDDSLCPDPTSKSDKQRTN